MTDPDLADLLGECLVDTAKELNAVIDLAERLSAHIVPLLGLTKDWPAVQRRELATISTTLGSWSLGSRHREGEKARARLLGRLHSDTGLL